MGKACMDYEVLGWYLSNKNVIWKFPSLALENNAPRKRGEFGDPFFKCTKSKWISWPDFWIHPRFVNPALSGRKDTDVGLAKMQKILQWHIVKIYMSIICVEVGWLRGGRCTNARSGNWNFVLQKEKVQVGPQIVRCSSDAKPFFPKVRNPLNATLGIRENSKIKKAFLLLFRDCFFSTFHHVEGWPMALPVDKDSENHLLLIRISQAFYEFPHFVDSIKTTCTPAFKLMSQIPCIHTNRTMHKPRPKPRWLVKVFGLFYWFSRDMFFNQQLNYNC
jgi:hypothetical protein